MTSRAALGRPDFERRLFVEIPVVCSHFQTLQEKTVGGLQKSQLMKNKRKAHAAGKTSLKRVQGWLTAVQTARKELGIKGFCPVGGKSAQGKALCAKAKALYAA